VKAALLRYRVMANIVGVLLIVLVLVGLPLNELHHLNAAWFPEGTSAQSAGAWISRNLGVAHGWLYMVFLVMAFLLSRKAKWDLPFTAVTLICGTVPILSFWAEHRATAQVQAQLATTSPHGAVTG
jgi:integral membrane protein